MAEGRVDSNSVANMFKSMFTPSAPKATSGVSTTENQVNQNQAAIATAKDTINPTQPDPNKTPNTVKPDDETTKSPLDQFTDLFDNSKVAETKDEAPAIAFTPENLQSLADGVSFTSNLPPELVTQLEGMGEQGKTMLALAELVGKQAYTTALNHAAVVGNKAVDMRSAYDRKGLGSQVRKHLVNDSLANSGSDNHPVVNSVKLLVAERLQAQHPEATTDWVNTQVQSFMTNLSTAQGAAPAPVVTKEANDVNWGDWLSDSPVVQ